MVRPGKRWFGPLPVLGKAIYPASWEGWAVTVATVLGLVMLKLVDDPVRRGIAAVLIAGGYCAVVLLTWGDDAD